MRLHNHRIISYLQGEVYRLRDELIRTQRENGILKRELQMCRKSNEWDWLF